MEHVIVVGLGALNEGKGTPLPVSSGDSVMYLEYVGTEFKGSDGSNYNVVNFF